MKMKKKTKIIIVFAVLVAVSAYFIAYIDKRTGVFKTSVYKSSVMFYSDEFGVDPLLVKAVMKRESNMNPEALSNKGAVGLMQIMPATGQDIANQLNLKNFDAQMLKEPDLNIRFGTFYLEKLLNYYDNNLILVLAAYNAGIRNVDKWLEADPKISKSISRIPFRETRRHTRAIIFTYNVYLGAERLKAKLKTKKA